MATEDLTWAVEFMIVAWLLLFIVAILVAGGAA